MATQYGATAVTDSATLILAANSARKGAICHNNGGEIIYVGPDSSITPDTGTIVYPAQTWEDKGLMASWRGAVYGIVVTGEVEMRYWEWEI